MTVSCKLLHREYNNNNIDILSTELRKSYLNIIRFQVSNLSTYNSDDDDNEEDGLNKDAA